MVQGQSLQPTPAEALRSCVTQSVSIRLLNKIVPPVRLRASGIPSSSKVNSMVFSSCTASLALFVRPRSISTSVRAPPRASSKSCSLAPGPALLVVISSVPRLDHAALSCQLVVLGLFWRCIESERQVHRMLPSARPPFHINTTRNERRA